MSTPEYTSDDVMAVLRMGTLQNRGAMAILDGLRVKLLKVGDGMMSTADIEEWLHTSQEMIRNYQPRRRGD